MMYFLFSSIPGQHATYSVAVLATSASDARQYMKVAWRGGKLYKTVESGKVSADCGAVTEAAGEIVHEKMKGITW